MKKNSARVFLCAGLCAAVMAGTGLTGFADTTEAGNMQQMQGRGMRQDDGSVMAKITAVTSSTLTVVMAEKPEMQNDGTMPEKPADGETPPEKPADGENPPEKPADGETPPEKPADGENPPEKPADGETPPQRQEGQMEQKEMNFSDEESSLTLTSDTVVTKGTDHESSSVSHLAEGSVVRLVLDGTTVVSIDILE
ncbi:hypothetical protein [Enterocloster citroniae]|uniref:hypothetical protein n=1 Tax=Enterocloster citroniae TaxID=358743 RepID=UPI00349F051A